MTEKKKRSRKPKTVKAPVEALVEEILEVAEVPEIIFTPEPELDIVFTPDPEIQELFESSDLEPEPEPEPEPKVVAKKDDPDMYGLTQTRFGRGKHTWRRRTRRLKGD